MRRTGSNREKLADMWKQEEQQPSGFNPDEVARILAPGGTFLTQQVHGLWAQDLLEAFDAKPQWPDETLSNNV